jgi:hypothetical protein
VTAGIPQLGLYATADADITAREQKRAAFLSDRSGAGGLDDLDVRHYNVGSAPQRRRSELGQFTLKALIIIGLIAGAFVLAATLVAPRIERVVENTEAKMQRYTKLGGAQFWAKVEGELERPPIRRMTSRLKRSENCYRKSRSSWSAGVPSWPKSRRYSLTFRLPAPPTVSRAAK